MKKPSFACATVAAIALQFALSTSVVTAQDDDAPPAPTAKAEVAEQSALPLPPPAGEIKAGEEDPLFEGDISYFTTGLSAKTIKVRKESIVTNVAGEKESRTFDESQVVDPQSGNLSPEQRLGLFVSVSEEQIKKSLAALSSTNDPETKAKMIATLKDQYKTRYAYDTAYGDFQARKAEAKASKLRAAVEARNEAAEKWIDAMVAIAQTKADGIAVMDLAPASSPVVRISSAAE